MQRERRTHGVGHSFVHSLCKNISGVDHTLLSALETHWTVSQANATPDLGLLIFCVGGQAKREISKKVINQQDIFR